MIAFTISLLAEVFTSRPLLGGDFRFLQGNYLNSGACRIGQSIASMSVWELIPRYRLWL